MVLSLIENSSPKVCQSLLQPLWSTIILTHTHSITSQTCLHMKSFFSMKILLHPKEWKYIPTKKLVLKMCIASLQYEWTTGAHLARSHLGPWFQPLDPLSLCLLWTRCPCPPMVFSHFIPYQPVPLVIWLFTGHPAMYSASSEKGFGLLGCSGLSWTFLSHLTSHCVSRPVSDLGSWSLASFLTTVSNWPLRFSIWFCSFGSSLALNGTAPHASS